MSGIKPHELTLFFARIHLRGLDTKKLAELVGCSRPTVTRILNGSRRRNWLWKRIAQHLTAEEVALLDVAHCSPWNNRRMAKRPRWTPDKAAELRGMECDFVWFDNPIPPALFETLKARKI